MTEIAGATNLPSGMQSSFRENLANGLFEAAAHQPKESITAAVLSDLSNVLMAAE